MKKRRSWLRCIIRRCANGRLLRKINRLRAEIDALNQKFKQSEINFEIEVSRLQFENTALNREIEVMSAVVARELQRVETETVILARRQRDSSS